MTTARTMTTKASIVPWTILDFALWVNVEERALLLVTGVESRVEITFRHLCHVIFVKELATVALFAQCTQPMFTHNCFLFGFDVTKRAEFLVALSLKVKLKIMQNDVNKKNYRIYLS